MNKEYRQSSIRSYEELDHLYSVMNDVEKWRVTLFYCLGWSSEKIADWDGCSRISVCETLRSAERKAKKVNRHEQLIDIIQRLFNK
jgi:hypothetical protein